MRTGRKSRTSICRVERGLYALRYVEAAASPGANARVTVLSGDMSFICAPGRESDTLAAPGHTLIILADTASEFEIQVVGAESGSTDAKFSIDMLDPGDGDAAPRGSLAAHRPANPGHDRSFRGRRAGDDGTAVAVTAHVSRRGDVTVGGGEWVAGPEAVLPIEGLSIATGRPDLGVRIRTRSIQTAQRWSHWHDPEDFAGSRRRADSLTAVALALTGDAAGRFEIVAEVMALGMPPMAERGRSVEFFGIDPIVGFRFRLQPARGDSGLEVAPAASPLRVFRAKR